MIRKSAEENVLPLIRAAALLDNFFLLLLNTVSVRTVVVSCTGHGNGSFSSADDDVEIAGSGVNDGSSVLIVENSEFCSCFSPSFDGHRPRTDFLPCETIVPVSDGWISLVASGTTTSDSDGALSIGLWSANAEMNKFSIDLDD